MPKVCRCAPYLANLKVRALCMAQLLGICKQCRMWALASLTHILKTKGKLLEANCSNPPCRKIWHTVLNNREIDEPL